MDREQFKCLKKGMVVRLKTEEQLVKEGWTSIAQEYGKELILFNDSWFEYSITEPMIECLGQKVRVAQDAEDMGDGVMDVWLEDFYGQRLYGSWTPGMIECCLDMIEAPGVMEQLGQEIEQEVNASLPKPKESHSNDWMTGFLAGYEMALKHMQGDR